MSAFTTKPSEFLDICICMLMDAVRHKNEFVTNDKWQSFLREGMLLGIKSVIYPLYLKTDPDARIRYKMLAKTLRGDGGCYIHITSEEGDEPEPLPSSKVVNKDLIKKIFKKVKDVRFKTSMPITEERLNKIIDYVVQKEKEDGRV